MISFRPHLGQDLVQCFDVDAPSRHFRSPAVFRIELVEPGGLTLGAVDPVDGVTLCLADLLLGLRLEPGEYPGCTHPWPG